MELVIWTLRALQPLPIRTALRSVGIQGLLGFV